MHTMEYWLKAVLEHWVSHGMILQHWVEHSQVDSLVQMVSHTVMGLRMGKLVQVRVHVMQGS